MSDITPGDNLNLISDFDDKFQKAIVGHMMRDRSFRLMVFAQNIEYHHFRDPYVAAVVGKIQKEKDNEVFVGTIGTEQMYQYMREDYRTEADRVKCKACIADAAHAALELKIEAVTQKMTGWIQLLRLKEMIVKATSMINRRDFDNALNYSQNVVKTLNQIDFTPESKSTVTFKNTVDFLLKQETDRFNNNCTIGSPEFDELLLRGAMIQTQDKNIQNDVLRMNGNQYPISALTKGSLAPGDATILLGPSNAGKTTVICTVVAMNLLMGKDILLIVHEQHADDIKTKLLQSMLFMDNTSLVALAKADKTRIEYFEQLIEKHLCYVHYIRAGQMNVEAVGGIIEIKQDKWKATHKGKGFDLLVNDYPGKLRARALDHRVNTKKHEEMAYVYDYLINMGREHKFHTFLAMQTNREGYKAVQGSNAESRVVDMGDAGESFSPMQLADNVITINRNDEDKRMEIIRLYVSKSRRAQTGAIFVSKTDMSKSRAFGPFKSEVYDSTGRNIGKTLHSFSCESKINKDEFAKLCADKFGEKARADQSNVSSGIQSQMIQAKAIMQATKQPSKAAEDLLREIDDYTKNQ